MEEHNHQPAEEPKPENQTEGAPAAAPEEKKPSAISRFFGYLFNKETKLGRFNRGLLRGLAIFIGVFAVGFLTAYFALYRPLTLQLQTANDDIASYQKELVTLRNDFTNLQENDAKLQNNYVALADVLKRQQAHTQLSSALADVQLARLALAGNNATLAKAALKDTKTKLGIVAAYLKNVGSTDGDLLVDRFDLALKVIDSADLSLASKDLLTLADALQELEGKYFPM